MPRYANVNLSEISIRVSLFAPLGNRKTSLNSKLFFHEPGRNQKVYLIKLQLPMYLEITRDEIHRKMKRNMYWSMFYCCDTQKKVNAYAYVLSLPHTAMLIARP